MVKKKLSLTIVIPVYNEKNRISLSIKALNNFNSIDGLFVKEVRFVNDGSVDNTLQILKNTKFKFPTKIISYTPNRGRGYAVKKGMEKISTDYAMYLDSDMSIPLDNLKSFFKYMQNKTDIIVGSKRVKGAICKKERDFIRKAAGIGHSLLFSAVLGIRLHDFEAGFKVFSKRAIEKIFPRLRLTRWGMDPEMVFVANKKGLSIKELPINWSDVEGSHVSPLTDIILALKDLASIVLNSLQGKYN